jgi:pimeloyl-ACP methyl ester carboxylesterase
MRWSETATPSSRMHVTQDFFSAHGVLQVTESQRSNAIALCHQSAQYAALACKDAFGTTDFRADLQRITVPTLVIHGDGRCDRTHRRRGPAHPPRGAP